MKARHVYLALLVLLFAGPAMAQGDRGGQGGDVESLRIAFITRKLSLTPEEAKQFWPVYDAHQAETKAVKKGMRADLTDARTNFESMSDKEIEQMMDRLMESKQKELDLTVKYHQEYKKVLPIRKVARLYKAEQQFTKMLLRRLQNQQPGAGAGNRPARRRGRF